MVADILIKYGNRKNNSWMIETRLLLSKLKNRNKSREYAKYYTYKKLKD